ncbi:DUF6901 family protein [Desulfonema magnum]|uniref:Uncharacterized protein n=1 Tax=Desulfonema magnum TaxID=45655 RepID=A0A975GT31_9BACT|nr:hypothetical protein [Desulfonema magnum]QTA91693.1 Uncharacterized protein dnm_077660 [Desulfonema magnum]
MIEYIFETQDGRNLNFQININRQYTDKINGSAHHVWTKLDYNQCKICPLSLKEYQCCPTAVDLQEIVEGFSPFLSHEIVWVKVRTSEREYSKKCDIQTGLQSLLGLVMATSACPVLSKLWSLAYFHLPFATTEDTLFRTVGAYLIRQYFIFSDGEKPDFELNELRSLYNKLEELNTSFTERIRIASKADANLNAVVQLGALSFMVHVSLEEQLRDFRRTFQGKLF